MVASLQLSFGLYVALLRPSMDLLDIMYTSVQFLLEGASTVLLVLPLAMSSSVKEADAASLQLAAFFCAITSVMMPVVIKVYDLLVAPNLILLRKTGRCFCGIFACVSVLAAVPTVLANFFGVEAVSTADVDLEGVADEAASVIESAADAGETATTETTDSTGIVASIRRASSTEQAPDL